MLGIRHIDHIEEYLIKYGPKALNKILQNIYSITLKFDGSPSVIVGVDEFQKSFVATKSYLNKIPIFYHTADDINRSNLDDNLQIKLQELRLAFEKDITISPDIREKYLINQGDMLWYPGSFHDTIEGYRVFHPNIIEYHVPLDLIRKNQNMGVFWHTDIRGCGLLEDSVNIWSPWMNLSYPNNLSIFDNDQYEINPGFAEGICAYLIYHYKLNSIVNIQNKEYVIYWYINYANNIINKYKSQAGKVKASLKYFPNGCYDVIVNALPSVYNEVMNLKEQLLNDLNKQTSYIKTFVIVDGIKKSCDHEGYVIASPYGTVKLVNRKQFTQLNQNPNVLRGWELK